MNHIFMNHTTPRPQALQPTHPWTRFVHAADGGDEPGRYLLDLAAPAKDGVRQAAPTTGCSGTSGSAWRRRARAFKPFWRG